MLKVDDLASDHSRTRLVSGSFDCENPVKVSKNLGYSTTFQVLALPRNSEGFVKCTFQMNVEILRKSTSKKSSEITVKKLANIYGKFETTFQVSLDYEETPEAVSQFSLIAYPSIRDFVAESSVRLGLPILEIPVTSLTELLAKED